jgi:Zn finger protein HypA/HybF involved in hydrogenase expression
MPIPARRHKQKANAHTYMYDLSLEFQMRLRKWTKEDFVSAVNSATSIAQVLIRLGLHPTGANYKTIHRYVKEYELTTDHWLGQGHLKGKNHSWNPCRSLNEICSENSTYTSTSKLKKRLLEAGLLQNKCSLCEQLPIWHGQSLVLVLDHVNGVSTDNRLENLRILCPHCHSQTSTFAGRNKKHK